MSDNRKGQPVSSDEAEIFDAIRFGDDDEVREAVEDLVRRYGSRLLEWLGRRGLTRAERDDVASTSWLRAWNRIKRFEYRGDGKFFAWLKAIARNVARETFRKRYATPTPGEHPRDRDDDESVDEAADDGLVLLLRNDFRAAVEATLADAPTDYRALITAHFFNETDLPEIQKQYGWTRSKLDVTKFRALAWLKRRLTEKYGERYVQDWLA